MKKLYGCRIRNSELPGEFQDYLDNLLRTGKVFNVEEYYNDTMTVIIKKDGNKPVIYLYRTAEVRKRADGKNTYYLGSTECTLSIVKDLKELRKEMIKRRFILDLDEMRQAYNIVESFVISLG